MFIDYISDVKSQDLSESSVLLEASVWETKYTDLDEFVPSGSKFGALDKINKASEKTLNNLYSQNDVFTKITNPDNPDKSEEFTEITHGSGNLEFYVRSNRTKELFKFSGSSGISGFFVKNRGGEGRQTPPGVSNTDYLETFGILALMGIKTFEEAIKYRNDELTIDLSKFSEVNEYTYAEISAILELTKPIGNPKAFIHKKIDKYYEALKNYEGIKQLKDNTADTVMVFKGGTQNVYTALNDKWALQEDLTNSGMIIFKELDGSGEVHWKQVSLKAGKDSARLGRITSIIKNIVDYDDMRLDESGQSRESKESGQSRESVKDQIIKEIRNLDYPDRSEFIWMPEEVLLSEGFGTFFKKALNLGKMTVSAFNKARASVMGFLGKIRDIFTPNRFKKTLDTDTAAFFKKYPDLKKLSELGNFRALTDSRNPGNINQELLSKSLNELVNIIDNQLTKAQKMSFRTGMVEFRSDAKQLNTEKAKTDAAIFNLLICNAISLTTLLRLLPQIEKQGPADHVAQILDVMRRGSTSLAVVVAYSDGTNPEVLQGVSSVSPKDTIPSVIAEIITARGDTHYVINMYYLTELSPDLDNSKFVKIQMTNANGGTSVSWKVEGQSADTLYKNIK